MGTYTIELKPEEEKSLLGDMISIQEWVENAIKNKARQMIDHYVTQSGLGSKMTPVPKKLEIIGQMEIETAAQRDKSLI